MQRNTLQSGIWDELGATFQTIRHVGTMLSRPMYAGLLEGVDKGDPACQAVREGVRASGPAVRAVAGEDASRKNVREVRVTCCLWPFCAQAIALNA